MKIDFFRKQYSTSEILYHYIDYTGKLILDFLEAIGKSGMFLIKSIIGLFQCGCKVKNVSEQMLFIGVKSSFIIILTGVFTGMVLALQGYYSLSKFGATALLGPAVALTLIRELGPVLTALMVVARAGSALTAEIGTMRVTEQIDAIEIMGIDPFSYLIMPNMVAAIIAFPLLTAIFDVVGVWGGCLVAVQLLNLSMGSYFGEMSSYVEMSDITNGIIKSVIFAVIVLWICLYMGFYTKGGAKGVSTSTTRAVVFSAVHIFMWDYLLTSILGY
ncbi:MAG: ABC transporter permease [Candidatus Aureabacteria bacterium]|nr:ABC transporter permease [Candidatus Auribacterota bacterium]